MLVTDNVRSLIGAFNKVHNYTKLLGAEVTIEQVDSLLGVDPISVRRRISPAKIISLVANTFGVNPEDIKSKSRHALVVLPRQVSMYLVRNLLQYSLEETAKTLNRKDHTTVLHAINKVSELIEKDAGFKQKILHIKGKLIG